MFLNVFKCNTYFLSICHIVYCLLVSTCFLFIPNITKRWEEPVFPIVPDSKQGGGLGFCGFQIFKKVGIVFLLVSSCFIEQDSRLLIFIYQPYMNANQCKTMKTKSQWIEQKRYPLYFCWHVSCWTYVRCPAHSSFESILCVSLSRLLFADFDGFRIFPMFQICSMI